MILVTRTHTKQNTYFTEKRTLNVIVGMTSTFHHTEGRHSRKILTSYCVDGSDAVESKLHPR